MHFAALFARIARSRLAQAQAAIEAIDYLPPDSEVYRRWSDTQPVGRTWDRWAMFVLVGVAVGLAGFAAHLLIDVLAFIKARAPAAAPALFLAAP